MEDVLEFSTKIFQLLNNADYTEAKSIINNKLNSLSPQQDQYFHFLAEIAGFFIDIGNETLDEESVNKGINILEENKNALCTIITIKSYFYNLANGKSALFKFDNKNNLRPSLEMVKPNLLDAKNYYFKAFKEINYNELEDLDVMILTNLGNTLSQFGRSIDAIKYFDQILKHKYDFIEALIGYAEALDYWIRISACPETNSLYSKIYYLLNLSIESGNILPYYSDIVRKN